MRPGHKNTLIKVVLSSLTGLCALALASASAFAAPDPGPSPSPWPSRVITRGTEHSPLLIPEPRITLPKDCDKRLLPPLAAKAYPIKVMVWLAIDRVTSHQVKIMQDLISHVLQTPVQEAEVSAFLPRVIQFLRTEFPQQMDGFAKMSEAAQKQSAKALEEALDAMDLGFEVYPMPLKQRLATIDVVRHPPKRKRPDASPEADLDALIRETAKNPTTSDEDRPYSGSDEVTLDEIDLAEAAIEIFNLRGMPGTLWANTGERGNKFPMLFLSRAQIEKLPYETRIWDVDGNKYIWEKNAIKFDDSIPKNEITKYGLNGLRADLPFDLGDEDEPEEDLSPQGREDPRFIKIMNALAFELAADLIYELRGEPGTAWFDQNSLTPHHDSILLLSREKIESLPPGTKIWDLSGKIYVLGKDVIPFDETLQPNVISGFGLNGSRVEPGSE